MRFKAAWNLRRVKTTFSEVEAALLKGAAPSADTLKALGQTRLIGDNLAERAGTESGRVVGHVLGVALRRGKVRWPALTRLAEAATGDDWLGRDLIAYLSGVEALNAHIVREDMLKATEPQVAAAAGALRETLATVEARFPGARSLNILRAGVVSLHDRSAARDLYAEALAEGWRGMASSIYDLGAFTYLSGPEIWARRGAGEELIPRGAVAEAIARRPGPYNRPWINLVWSVDPGFLRIYGPQWFGLAPYLLNDGIGMVMLVVGPKGERDLAIDQARELIAGLARYRDMPNAEAYADAVAFVGVDVPAMVGETKTFYASARYLAALPIMDETGAPVLILDADQSLRDPLAPFARKLMKADAGITRSKGLAVLWPWRRNMAGTAFFAPTPGGRAMLARIRDYVVAGLPQEPSWTLDQNALAFAMEQAGDIHLMDLGDGARPLFQEKVRSLFEKTWREGPPTPP